MEFIKDTVKAYVEAEHTFLNLIFSMGDQEDLTLEQAKDFIEYLGELRLYQLGMIPEQDVRENPLSWIEYILTATSHANFFEKRSVDYSHNKLEGTVDYSKYLELA